MFINRIRELAFLEKRYGSNQAELVVLYGRRRGGKTELLRRFCEGKRHFFYVADLGTTETTLAEVAKRYGELFHDDPDNVHFATWDQAFKALVRQAENERLIVVLDEFTYLLQTDAAFPSILSIASASTWNAAIRDGAPGGGEPDRRSGPICLRGNLSSVGLDAGRSGGDSVPSAAGRDVVGCTGADRSRRPRRRVSSARRMSLANTAARGGGVG